MPPGVAVLHQVHLDQSSTNTSPFPFYVLMTSHKMQKTQLVATGHRAQDWTKLKAFPGSLLRIRRGSRSAGPESAFLIPSSSYHGRFP